MKKIKLIVTLVIIVIVLLAGAFAALNLGLFDAKGDELAIDKTANVVTEIKKISEFTSACFYEEIVLQESKKRFLMTDEIVIIANGKVRAGFNLKDLADENIVVTGDTLNVTLPKAEIFDVLVNPSDFDIYIEDGTWDDPTVTAIKNKAITQIKEDALKDGILEKAQESGIKKLTELFKNFGFSEVMITVE